MSECRTWCAAPVGRWAIWLGGLAIGLWVLCCAPLWLVYIQSYGLSATQEPWLSSVADARTALLQLVAGIAVLYGLVLNAQRIRELQRQNSLTEQGQATERFTRAVEQLAHPDASVRMGGVFALERIARDSVEEWEPVMAVLTAHVRARRPLVDGPKGLDPFPEELQAILDVVGRAERPSGCYGRADLARTDLRGCRLSGFGWGPVPWEHEEGHWVSGADFDGSDLRGADLCLADLRGTHFFGADMRDANLHGRDLRTSWLSYADLRGADLGQADLSRAELLMVNMQGAKLNGANLLGAKFVGVNLRDAMLLHAEIEDADLRHSNLDWALVDDTTRDALDPAFWRCERDPRVGSLWRVARVPPDARVPESSELAERGLDADEQTTAL